MNYTLIRSSRKTLSLEITREGELLVRAPLRASIKTIEKMIEQKRRWIAKHTELQKRRAAHYPPPTPEELSAWVLTAKHIIPPLVEKYAAIMGVSPSGIRITKAQKRFGSCSGKNSLSFSCRLVRYPKEAIEYVIVHELSHILHHDHSKAFWQTVEHYLPNYRSYEALLKGDSTE